MFYFHVKNPSNEFIVEYAFKILGIILSFLFINNF